MEPCPSKTEEPSHPCSKISKPSGFHNLPEEDQLLLLAQLPGAYPILLAEQFNLVSPPGPIKIIVEVLFMVD